MSKFYDAVIIGTGQAGPALASRLTRTGMKVAIIERKLFGGTCVNVGCIPTKALVASARAAHMVRRASDFGVMIDGTVGIDMQRVKARKDQIVAQSRQGVIQWLKTMANLDVYENHGQFESERTVRVGDELLEANKIFIDVGARAHIPPMPGLDEVNYFTNANMMEVDFLPEHLIIVGGSYIGLEFAQMYRRFGSRVTVVEKAERLLNREDQDISEAIETILNHEGVELRLQAECITASRQNNQIGISVDCQLGGPPTIVGSHLLLAVGRTPNTTDLGLDKAGVKTDARGYIIVDDQLRTNVPGIWALGEVNGRGAFTHTAYNDYEIVAANLLDQDPRRVSDRILCYGLFIDPPLGRVGLSEQQVKASGRRALLGKMAMNRVGRARERSETQGFMKVLVDAEDQKILGAAILGIGGDEVVHSLLDIMYAGAPYSVIQRAVHIHPTVTELIPTLLGNLKPLS